MMEGEENQSQNNASVYVIEDDFQVRDYICHSLKKIGYTVDGFDDAELAYKSISTGILTDHHAHVVLLNPILQREREPAERFLIKMTETVPQTRVIVMSGVITPREFFEYIFKGASGYFPKPISNSCLREIVKKHVDISKKQWKFSREPWASINRTNRELFLCYAREDLMRARGLARLLENSDLDVWYADQALPPGSDWKEMLNKALDRCPVFLCLLSKTALQSKWVREEIKKALDRKKCDVKSYHFIPLLFNMKLNNITPDDITKELKNFHCVDVSDGDHLVDSFQALRLSIDTFFDVYNQ